MGKCQQKGNFNLITTISLTIHHCGIAYNKPYFQPNILLKYCFQSLLDMAVILRQTENYDFGECKSSNPPPDVIPVQYSAGKAFTTGSNSPGKQRHRVICMVQCSNTVIYSLQEGSSGHPSSPEQFFADLGKKMQEVRYCHRSRNYSRGRLINMFLTVKLVYDVKLKLVQNV